MMIGSGGVAEAGVAHPKSAKRHEKSADRSIYWLWAVKKMRMKIAYRRTYRRSVVGQGFDPWAFNWMTMVSRRRMRACMTKLANEDVEVVESLTRARRRS